jgi:hypothetical protein
VVDLREMGYMGDRAGHTQYAVYNERAVLTV